MKKIIIIEDSKIQGQVINDTLEKYNEYQTFLCGDCFEAYAILTQEKDIDCLLIDLDLPYVGGLTFVEKLATKNEFSHLRIILSSGHHDQAETMANNPNMLFLSKPYKLSQLISIIEDSLNSA